MSVIAEKWERLQEFAYSKLETEQITALREGLKGAMHTAKVVATVTLVISIAVTFFSSVVAYAIGGSGGVLLGLATLFVGGAIGLLSYDITIAAEKGYHLASKAGNFAIFNSPSNQAALINHCQKLVTQMLSETYLLKRAHHFVFTRYWEVFANLLESTARNRR